MSRTTATATTQPSTTPTLTQARRFRDLNRNLLRTTHALSKAIVTRIDGNLQRGEFTSANDS